jgi:hypothetical protein
MGPMSKHDLDADIDPGTRRVLLKFNDGSFEATRLPASRFALPGYIGRTRAEIAVLLTAQP